jgi:hypothetical protein
MVRRFAVFSVAILFFTASWTVLGQGGRTPQEEQDAQTLLIVVDAALIADLGISEPAAATDPATPAPAPVVMPLGFGAADRSEGEIPVSWDSGHFIKGQSGDTYVPFSLSVDDPRLSEGAALYIRIVNADQAAAFGQAMAALMTAPAPTADAPAMARPAVGWESLHFIDSPRDGKIERAVELKPGQYVAFVALKGKTPAPSTSNRGRNDRNAPAEAAAAPAPPVMGLLRHELTVPDFGVADLITSSVILAQSIEPLTQALPANQQEANPYVFGPMRISPSPNGQFSKASELNVIFWIYGASPAASGKPDVSVGFRFHQQLADGEKYFNRTAPQDLNAETLPPEFSLEAGHQLPGSLVVPLASFPAGNYRLEITITDKASGKEIVQNANFTVLPV